MLIWSVGKFFGVIYLLIFIRIVLSWVRVNSYNKYVVLVYQLTDPVLEPFKNLMYRLGLQTGMIDFSPLIAYMVLQIIENFIKRIILSLP